MAQKRPIEIAVLKVYGAMLGVTVVFFGTLTLWVWLTSDQNGQEPLYMNTAFTLSWLITLVMVAGILEFAKRRPADATLSWGQANMGAMYVFLLMFWVYGVVPHQFLVYADNELSWRVDRLVVGPTGLGFTDGEGLLSWILPFQVTYLVVRDIFAVTIYGLALAANVALFAVWQSRGKVAPADEVEQSTYGRPLVREGV